MSINRSLRALLAASIALVAAIALAACGGDDEVGGGSDADVEVAKPGPPVEGEFNISNWVGYIDTGEGSTIDEFEAKYPDITVNYTEDVNDNVEFFGKVQPLLDQGESGGREHVRGHRLDGRSRCTTSATCRRSTTRTCPTSTPT